MASVHPAVFRAYDVRGRYPDEVNEELARRLGNRVAAYLRAGNFVVGRDARRSSPGLAEAVMEGAGRAGAAVLDVGEVSTPQFQWAIRSLDAAGGIMVTASHLAEPNNGFKAVARRGGVLEVLGGDKLRQIADLSAAQADGGVIRRERITDGYAAAVAYAAGWEGGGELRAAVDAPGAIQRVLLNLGPTAPDAELAARCDADGDRIAFFLYGVEVPADEVFLLLAERLRLAPLAFDLRFSRAVREHLDHAEVPYAVTRVGRLYLSLAMRQQGAALGAELSGHYYWRAMGGMECPELTLLHVLRICEGDVGTLDGMMRPYRRYAKSPEINIPVRDHKHAASIIAQLERRYAGCRMDKQDGLTMDCWSGYLSVPAEEGFWFNIRPSHTEPVLRLVVESKEKDLLGRRVAEVRGLINP
jgi:phosphomannomutase